MKLNKLNTLALSLLCGSLLFTSCNEDDATGASTLIVNDGVTGVVTTDFDSSVTINVDEFDEDAFTYSVTITEAQPVDIQISVKQIAGDATEDEDFTFDHTVVIPAYSLTAVGNIAIKNDVTVEGMEGFTLQIGDINTSNASIPTKTVSFTINNYLSADLDLTFNFDQDFSYQGDILSSCAIGYDMDYYVLDSSFNDTGIYDAADSGCPEHLTLSADGSLADGVYYIYYEIYDDGGLDNVYHDIFEIPTTVDYIRAGGITAGSFTQEAAFVPNSVSGNGDSEYVITIELNAGVFTLSNNNSDILATGKSNNRAKALASIKAARAKRANKIKNTRSL